MLIVDNMAANSIEPMILTDVSKWWLPKDNL